MQLYLHSPIHLHGVVLSLKKKEVQEQLHLLLYNGKQLKMGVEPTPEMSCISNILQTMDNAQYNIHIINSFVTSHIL
jgi:hypothetical protein